ncbi:MAG: DUF4384 domain-containing protein [Candidatus Obscuribacterales bacterium]|nr:DUF4384 domain-containing protein [Candidatus Obscuribacterales bacterium]
MTQRLIVLTLLVMIAVGAAAEAADEPGCSKAIFREQMENPTEKLNTGVKYWIELYRGGKMTLVDNRTKFISGDKIRFRVIPNINGYAYIAMRKGSSGKAAVLFPPANSPNKVIAGKKYSMPAVGFLTFDKQPGTEQLSLVVSRTPVNATSLLNMESQHSLVTVASNTAEQPPSFVGSQLVTYPEQETAPLPTEEEPSKDIENGDNFSKDLFYEGPPRTNSTKPRKGGHRRIVRRYRPTGKRTAVKPPAATPPGVIVLNIDPAKLLGATIQLEHQ